MRSAAKVRIDRDGEAEVFALAQARRKSRLRYNRSLLLIERTLMNAPSFPEIRTRLQAFAKQWKQAERENADAKLFWARFYECFGIRPESATIYEKAVDKLDGTRGFIDSFIPGVLIVEHKSKGKDLKSAFTQASDYFTALAEGERPRFIIVSDFV
jgi:hypothetical protein